MHGSNPFRRGGPAVDHISSRILLPAALVSPVPAIGSPNFTQPTPDGLKMTSDPAAPGAAAVYLFREETGDDDRHTFFSLFADEGLSVAAGFLSFRR